MGVVYPEPRNSNKSRQPYKFKWHKNISVTIFSSSLISMLPFISGCCLVSKDCSKVALNKFQSVTNCSPVCVLTKLPFWFLEIQSKRKNYFRGGIPNNRETWLKLQIFMRKVVWQVCRLRWRITTMGPSLFFLAHFFIMAISANLTTFIILNKLVIPTILEICTILTILTIEVQF